MRIEFDLAQAADWATGLPTWAWVAAAAHTWYLAAGLVLRRLARKYGHRLFGDSPPVKEKAIFFWVISPLIVVFVVAVWPAASVSSGFLIQPPWRYQWIDSR